MNDFFSDPIMIDSPNVSELVLFSCDNIYFEKYGIFNLLSCDTVNHDVHIHIINPSEKNLNFLKKIKNILKIKLSFSIEYVNADLNFYAIKSYYYCSRFYVARWLCQDFSIKKIHIVDADVIFNEKIFIPNEITLCLNYNSDANNFWQKIMAGYIFISKEEMHFFDEVLEEYKNRYKNTDFEKVSNIENKIEKANFTGLDQVCLSIIFEKNQKQLSLTFLNIKTENLNIIGKEEKGSKIWALLTKAKKNNIEKYLYKKYINYFKDIDYDSDFYRI
jgi:hypothetical protein